MSKESGTTITLEGVSNQYHALETETSKTIHEYILKTVFKELYQNSDRKKQQVFMFFNSANEIE